MMAEVLESGTGLGGALPRGPEGTGVIMADSDRSADVVDQRATRSESAARVKGERRVVTVVFADVVNSTGLAEKLDPEDWTEIMNGAFPLLTAPIRRYEGTVGRLMGDGMLAFFGAPTSHEDDPQRAVLAALDIIDAVKAYGARM